MPPRDGRVPDSSGRITTDYIRSLVADPAKLVATYPSRAECPALYKAEAAAAAFKAVEAAAHDGDVQSRRIVDLVTAYAEGQLEEQAQGLDTRTRPVVGNTGDPAIARCINANKDAHVMALGPAFRDLPQLTWLNVCTLHAYACRGAMRAPNTRQIGAAAAAGAAPTNDMEDEDGVDDGGSSNASGGGPKAVAGTTSFVPGEIRKSNVRIGRRRCADHTVTKERLAEFLIAYRDLDQRAGPNVSPFVKAAALVLGINEIHPFADGNGRVARVLANWALVRGGVPFSVVMCASEHYRRRYVDCLKAAMLDPDAQFRTLVSLMAEVTWNTWQYVVVAADGFAARVAAAPPPPFARANGSDATDLEADGAADADGARSFRSPGGTGSGNVIAPSPARPCSAVPSSVPAIPPPAAAGAAAGSKTPRRSGTPARSPRRPHNLAEVLREARRDAREGQCIVCMEDTPTVAMLCCGAPAHVECMARWLRRAEHGDNGTRSCPQCRCEVAKGPDHGEQRGAMHPPPQQQRAPPAFGQLGALAHAFAVAAAAGWRAPTAETTDDDDDDGDDTSSYERNNAPHMHMEDTDDTGDEEEYDDDDEDDRMCPECRERQYAFACEHGLCAQCCASESFRVCARHGLTGNQTAAATGPALCTTCYDRQRATECSNDMCANCCRDSGTRNCDRHGIDWRSESDEEEDDDTSEAADNSPPAPGACRHCQMRQHANECSNRMCAPCCGDYGRRSCDRHGVDRGYGYDSDDTSDSSSESGVFGTDNGPPPCNGYDCSNRAAMDCNKQMCGACCRLAWGYCARHGI